MLVPSPAVGVPPGFTGSYTIKILSPLTSSDRWSDSANRRGPALTPRPSVMSSADVRARSRRRLSTSAPGTSSGR